MSIDTITKYAHISSDPRILSGVPIIAGTRTPVRAIAQSYFQLEMTVNEIRQTMPHLSEADIHAALLFYLDFREEIDADIRRNEDFDYWKSVTVQHPGTSRRQHEQ